MIKDLVKGLVPHSVLALRRRLKIAKLRRRFARLSMREAFEKTYSESLWGGGPGVFCSGAGSLGRVARIYVEYVCQFIRDHRIEVVVDLGCGDFRVGEPIAAVAQRYVGVDVVPELIAFLQHKYGSERIEFRCCDITEAELPSADCAFVRQVFQHLSNAEIAAVIPKLRAYRYCLITEHYPPITDSFVPNRDKPHGPDMRLRDDSAVVLTAPPFSVASVSEILRIEPDTWQVSPGETIRTFLIS